MVSNFIYTSLSLTFRNTTPEVQIVKDISFNNEEQ